MSCGGRERKQQHNLLFLVLTFDTVLQNSTLEKFFIICRSERDGINTIQFEAGSANSLFKRPFFSRRRRCCLSSLFITPYFPATLLCGYEQYTEPRYKERPRDWESLHHCGFIILSKSSFSYTCPLLLLREE